MIIAITVGVLVSGGVYLMLQRSMVRTIFGLALISHAANFALLLSGVPAWRGEPIAVSYTHLTLPTTPYV